MRLSDGRLLAWSEWGRVDGLPVLFCTGAAMSRSLGFGVDDVIELGLRLIAVDRPGLGASDPHPTKTLLSWATDICELIQVNHLHQVTTVGFSQGAPFAFVLAEQEIVEAIAIVSGQDELMHPQIRPLLTSNVAQMLVAIEQDPPAFEQYVAQSFTWERMWQLIIDMSAACDRHLYLTEPFSQAFQRCLQEGFSQGAQGYARDLVNAASAWPMTLEKITIPVDLWYGHLDTSTVHSPDFGVTLASRLSHVNHTLDPDSGGSILWTRSKDILSTLKSHL